MLDSSSPLQWNKTGQVLTCWTLMPVCYDITKQYKRRRVRQWYLFAMNNSTGQVLNATQTCFPLQAAGEDNGTRGRGRGQRRPQLWSQPLWGSWGWSHCAGIPFSCDGPLSLLSTSATQTTHSYNISSNPVKQTVTVKQYLANITHSSNSNTQLLTVTHLWHINT